MAEFSDLPDEIIEYIISLLNIKEIILVIPLVNKRLYNISNQPYLWHCMYQQIISNDRKIFQTQKSYDYYRRATNPRDNKSVLAYLKCDYCQKYCVRYKNIHHCTREHRICLKCQLMIQSYVYLVKCMDCATTIRIWV